MKKIIIIMFLAVPFLFTQPVLAKSKIDKAKELASIGKKYVAKNLLDQAIIDDPLNADLHFEAGIVYLNLGYYKDFNLGMENACRFEQKYCYKAGELYYVMAFNSIDGQGTPKIATWYFHKAFKHNKSKRQEAVRRLFASGNEYLSKGEIRRAKEYYKVTLNLEPMFRDSVAKSFFEAGKKASPMEALKLFKEAISYSDSYKKPAAKSLARNARQADLDKYQKNLIKDWVERWVGKTEFKKLFPPDYREFKVGRKHEYRINNMKSGESNGFYIRSPRGFPTKQFVTSFGTKVKAVLRDGREFDLSNGKPLPDGDYDFKFVAYEDGARALVWFER